MQSKRDRLFEAVEALGSLCCPVCGGAVRRQKQNLSCDKGHTLNVNRRGCVNLLTRQAEGCYDAALFEARQRVFARGCYLPVADAIETLLPSGPQRLLDAGCGEGWYLNTLLTRHSDWQGAGVDISRDAILRATDWPCTALWCVGDLRRLPFADGAFTAVLDILTPAGYHEFRRVLCPGGVLIKVYPGSSYLKELRAARGMPPYAEGQVDAYLREHGHVLAERHVHSSILTDDALWRDFVWMTPLNQDLSAQEKQRLAAYNPGAVTLDLHLASVSLSA